MTKFFTPPITYSGIMACIINHVTSFFRSATLLLVPRSPWPRAWQREPIAVGAGAAAGTSVGVGFAGWKTIQYFTAKGDREKAT